MARKNIFEVLQEKNSESFEVNIMRLRTLYERYYFVSRVAGGHYTLKQFVDEFSFDTWKARGRCIDLNDF